MYNPNYYDWAPSGWRCPQCGRVYSPTTPMCFYCSNKETTVQTTVASVNDNEWWQEYLKKSRTSNPVNDNPSTTTATTNVNPNVKVSTWNNVETDQIKIGSDGSINGTRPTPKVTSNNNSYICEDILDSFIKHFQD